MRRECETCRWWHKVKANEPEICNNVDSDNRFDTTAKDYSCNKWSPQIEQDGDATWWMD